MEPNLQCPDCDGVGEKLGTYYGAYEAVKCPSCKARWYYLPANFREAYAEFLRENA